MEFGQYHTTTAAKAAVYSLKCGPNQSPIEFLSILKGDYSMAESKPQFESPEFPSTGRPNCDNRLTQSGRINNAPILQLSLRIIPTHAEQSVHRESTPDCHAVCRKPVISIIEEAIGDSGYLCRPWLLIPVPSPHTRTELKFNESHRSTRSAIERTFCVLKMRFRVLGRAGGDLQYSPEKCNDIILVCCMLHNIAISQGNLEELCPEDPKDGIYVPQDILNRHTTRAGVQTVLKLLKDISHKPWMTPELFKIGHE
ncbi:uncharacterized protein LOC128652266 [Bombina bombina]|uniref:uncharacterized protein LOC128652266 n=1 Tax=Bombina bombina TaxID=8345 RepID=UPI00235A7E53|nr:uncharacterized protein LOC128652266 [Bombina bombina]